MEVRQDDVPGAAAPLFVFFFYSVLGPASCTGSSMPMQLCGRSALVLVSVLFNYFIIFYMHAYAYIHSHTFALCIVCIYIHTVLHGLEACSRGKCSSDAYIQLMLRRHNVASVYVLRKVGGVGYIIFS